MASLIEKEYIKRADNNMYVCACGMQPCLPLIRHGNFFDLSSA